MIQAIAIDGILAAVGSDAIGGLFLLLLAFVVASGLFPFINDQDDDGYGF